MALVAAGELAAALVALEAPLPGLARRPLGDDPFLLCAPRRHPLGRGKGAAAAAALADQQVLLLDEGHCLREQALAVCSTQGAHEPGLRATSLPTLVQMVAAGAGVTLLPRWRRRWSAGGPRWSCAGSAHPNRSGRWAWSGARARPWGRRWNGWRRQSRPPTRPDLGSTEQLRQHLMAPVAGGNDRLELHLGMPWVVSQEGIDALVLGSIGVVLGIAGAIAFGKYGPAWYSVAIIAISLPCAWAGARLARRR